ncbi:MAG: sulfatase [Myxococcota bacterium]|jgi:arylsulfatase A-like enzyme|nr:sulfatase [Myxococcota bacterium]
MSARTGTGLLCLLAAMGAALACEPGKQRARPDVLLITIDTLRADYVHAYGFPLEITPSIDALAARGVLFENAIAAATLTAPAHASIMTSRYVREHSIGSRNGDTRLHGLSTLAETFSEAGYSTAAFISNAVLRRRIGLDRGFETYDDELPSRERNRGNYFERIAEETAGNALEWLALRPAADPVFLWLHLQDPHGPYTPPAEWVGRVGDFPLSIRRPLGTLRANSGRAGIPLYQVLEDEIDPAFYAGRYAEEIQYADHWVGQVIAAVERHGEERGSVILLTADHGESLGESGWFFQHGQSTAPELARVPFVLAAPGLEAARIRGPVSHVDIAPTLIALAGLPELPGARGRALEEEIRNGEVAEDRLIFCDTDGESAAYSPGSWTRVGGSIASDRVGDVMQATRAESIRLTETGKWRPSDLDSRALRGLEEYLEARTPLVAAGPMEPQHIDELRALGYLPPAEEEPEEPDPRAAEAPVSENLSH